MVETLPALSGLRASGRRLQGLARAGLDLVLPPRCLGCGNLVPVETGLCAGCWGRLRFLRAPLCPGCGHPLIFGAERATGCTACRGRAMPVDRVRSALAYDDASRGLVIGFKHGGRIEAASLFARWMADAGAELLAEADLVLPVPLHRWRLLRRGYNQAGLLARAVARGRGGTFRPWLLRRVRATRSQQGLGAGARGSNVTAAAFGLTRGGEGLVAGRRILLVDDVLTTGATLGACALALRAAGAVTVDALTLARVVRESAEPI